MAQGCLQRPTSHNSKRITGLRTSARVRHANMRKDQSNCYMIKPFHPPRRTRCTASACRASMAARCMAAPVLAPAAPAIAVGLPPAYTGAAAGAATAIPGVPAAAAAAAVAGAPAAANPAPSAAAAIAAAADLGVGGVASRLGGKAKESPLGAGDGPAEGVPPVQSPAACCPGTAPGALPMQSPAACCMAVGGPPLANAAAGGGASPVGAAAASACRLLSLPPDVISRIHWAGWLPGAGLCWLSSCWARGESRSVRDRFRAVGR